VGLGLFQELRHGEARRPSAGPNELRPNLIHFNLIF